MSFFLSFLRGTSPRMSSNFCHVIVSARCPMIIHICCWCFHICFWILASLFSKSRNRFLIRLLLLNFSTKLQDWIDESSWYWRLTSCFETDRSVFNAKLALSSTQCCSTSMLNSSFIRLLESMSKLWEMSRLLRSRPNEWFWTDWVEIFKHFD